MTAALILFSFYSCQKDELEFKSSDAEATMGANLNNFRKKVVNPYTIPNMQKALDNLIGNIQKGQLKSTDNGKAPMPKKETITPNILYIKFTPQTYEEEGLLKRDSTLALIDYPLGYEYDESFFENRPPLKKGEIPAYYTTVAVNRELPSGVPYEVLEEMYLPQMDESLENNGKAQLYKTAKGVTADFVKLLLHQAFKQTNNLGLDGLGMLKKEKERSQTKGIFGDKWLPRGTLHIWDDNIGSTTTVTKVFDHIEYYECDDPLPGGGDGPDPIMGRIIQEPQCSRIIYRYETETTDGSYVPLAGAQVLLRATFTIGNEITNSEGYFQFDHKRGQKRYIIQWERYQYSIRNGSFFQAETRGPKQDTRWDHDIKGGDDAYHGMIHLAAYDYYYGSRFGLTSPPRNETHTQIKIAAREINGGDTGSSYSHIRNDLSMGIVAQIHIKAWNRSSDRVYGNTIHELAHAAHSVVDRDTYNSIVRDAYWLFWQGGAVENNNRRLLETWAATVELMFALKRYRDDAGNPNYNYGNWTIPPLVNLQNLRISDENHYTSAGYDMIDNVNQRTDPDFGNGSSAYPIDRVSGYSLQQLENALVGADSWWEWRDNIKNKFDNDSEEYLAELFNNWPN